MSHKRPRVVCNSVSEAVELAESLQVGHVTVPAWAQPAFSALPFSSCPRGRVVDLMAFEEAPLAAAAVVAASSLRCRVAIPNGRPVVWECSVGGLLWSPLLTADLVFALRERGMDCNVPEQLPGGECRLEVGGGELSAGAVVRLREKSSSISARTAGDRELLAHVLTPLLGRPL